MAKKKVTFNELYEAELQKPTAAQAFVSKVAALTFRSENTVRMWLSGRQIPDALAREQIAKEFGVDAAHLFIEEESK